MKKFIRCMGVGLLAMMLVVGCGSKAKGVSDDDLVSKDSFKGEYLITAKEAKKLMGDDNVIFLDCRGEKYSNKETIKGAAATSWQALGTCEDKYGKQAMRTGEKFHSLQSYLKNSATSALIRTKKSFS